MTSRYSNIVKNVSLECHVGGGPAAIAWQPQCAGGGRWISWFGATTYPIN
jgi:hypothetical protein